MATGLIARILRFERGRRFWRHVRVAGPDECWLWEGELDAAGRPLFDSSPAEARAYELALGTPPPTGAVEHRCGDERCVNPEHLRPVPPAA